MVHRMSPSLESHVRELLFNIGIWNGSISMCISYQELDKIFIFNYGISFVYGFLTILIATFHYQLTPNAYLKEICERVLQSFSKNTVSFD